MAIIEMGALASAVLAILTLIDKLWHLIEAIQGLIQHMHTLQDELRRLKMDQHALKYTITQHHKRLISLENQSKRKEDVHAIQTPL